MLSMPNITTKPDVSTRQNFVERHQERTTVGERNHILLEDEESVHCS